MEFILDYSKWRCGGNGENALGEGKTQLLNYEGYQCCIGQWCEQQGISKEILLYTPFPCDLERKIKSFTKRLKGIGVMNTWLSKRAMVINDDAYTTPTEKIRLLKKLLSKFKHKITVINVPNDIA